MEGKRTYIFTKENIEILEDLLYTAKANDMTSQRTTQYLKDLAREKEIKQEILNGL